MRGALARRGRGLVLAQGVSAKTEADGGKVRGGMGYPSRSQIREIGSRASRRERAM